MAKILTTLAQYKGEYREVFNVRKGGDESIYLMASSDYNPHISIHKSGVLHVTYPYRDGKKIRLTIEGGHFDPAPYRFLAVVSLQKERILFFGISIFLFPRRLQEIAEKLRRQV